MGVCVSVAALVRERMANGLGGRSPFALAECKTLVHYNIERVSVACWCGPLRGWFVSMSVFGAALHTHTHALTRTGVHASGFRAQYMQCARITLYVYGCTVECTASTGVGRSSIIAPTPTPIRVGCVGASVLQSSLVYNVCVFVCMSYCELRRCASDGNAGYAKLTIRPELTYGCVWLSIVQTYHTYNVQQTVHW